MHTLWPFTLCSSQAVKLISVPFTILFFVVAKVFGSWRTKFVWGGYMAVPVFLVDFDCVDVAISFLAFVRFGQDIECESIKSALLQ